MWNLFAFMEVKVVGFAIVAADYEFLRFAYTLHQIAEIPFIH